MIAPIRSRAMLGLLCVLCAAFAALHKPQPARAAQGAQWALLVGINQYENKAISPLNFAVEDVKTVAKTLVDHAGFQPENVFVMTSDASKEEDQPTNDRVVERLQWLAKKVKPEDSLWFYFAGHGYSKSGKSYLATMNANPASTTTLKLTSIPLELLQEEIAGIKSRQVVLLIDACRNDPEAGRGEGDNPRTEAFSRSLRVALEAEERPGGSGLFFACSEGERAWEDPTRSQGVFSYFLVDAIKKSSGPTSLDKLAADVRTNVLAWCDDKNKRKQTPEFIPIGKEQVVLPAVPPKPMARTPGIPNGTGTLTPPQVDTQMGGVSAQGINPADLTGYYVGRLELDNSGKFDFGIEIRKGSDTKTPYVCAGYIRFSRKDQRWRPESFGEAVHNSPEYITCRTEKGDEFKIDKMGNLQIKFQPKCEATFEVSESVPRRKNNGKIVNELVTVKKSTVLQVKLYLQHGKIEGNSITGKVDLDIPGTFGSSIQWEKGTWELQYVGKDETACWWR